MPSPSRQTWPRARAARQKIGLERVVNDIADRSLARQRIERKRQGIAVVHAGAGGIDQKRGIAGGLVPVFQSARDQLASDHGRQGIAQRLGARRIAVENMNGGDVMVGQRQHCAARSLRRPRL